MLFLEIYVIPLKWYYPHIFSDLEAQVKFFYFRLTYRCFYYIFIFLSNEIHIIQACSFCCINRLQNGALLAFTTLFSIRIMCTSTNITDKGQPTAQQSVLQIL